MKKQNFSFFLLSFAAAVSFGGAANATTYFTEKFECPIGGERFKADVVVSNSTFGQRADGKPYSPLPVYPITECPGNGLLLFDDFTDDELRVLEGAIKTPEYQSMRSTETPHFRAAWLKKKIGRDIVSQLSSLLQATWETDNDVDRKIRYQSLFVETATSMRRADETSEAWLWYNLRAVNALRELGYFAEAIKHLQFVMMDENLPADPQTTKNAKDLAGRLGALLMDQNHFPEPANIVPPDIAMFRCVVPTLPLTSAEIVACAATPIQASIGSFEYKPKKGKKLRGEAAIRAADAEDRAKREQVN